MSSTRIWSGITKTLLTLGVSMLIIGITLLTIPGSLFTVGVFFLVAGVVGVIIYLLFTIIACFTKRSSTQTETAEPAVRGRPNQANNQESNSAAFSVPPYEEVVDSRYEIWTVDMASSQIPLDAELEDPPPYSAMELEAESDAAFTSSSIRRTSVTDRSGTPSLNPTPDHSSGPGTHSSIRPVPKPMMPHRLQRYSSDIHEVLELKDLSMHLEPLTPPPAYLDNLANPFAEAQFQAAQ